MEPKNKKNTKLILIIAVIISVPVLLFVGTILYEWGMSAKQHSNTMIFGSVDGVEIRFLDYMTYLQNEKDRYKEANNKILEGKELEKTKNEIWDMLVKQKIIQQNIKKYSIKADEKEIENIMYKKPESLPEEVKSVFYDSKGNFNEDVYLKSIKIDSPDNIKFRENVKNILREDIENNMLMDIVAKDIILSTEELKPGIDDKLKNKLLKKKKVKQFEIWLEEMKLLAKIVDNRKKFEK